MEFAYDNATGKPMAARLSGHAWQYKRVSLAAKPNGADCSLGLQKGVVPAVVKFPATHSKPELKVFRASTYRFRQAFLPGEEDEIYQQAQAAFEDLQWVMEGLYEEITFDLYPPGPERERCINLCNDVTDLAWIGCTSFGALGVIGGAPGAAAGIVLGIGCATYFYEKRESCRRDCARW